MELTKSRLTTLSSFFNDVSKGLLLGTVAGQAFTTSENLVLRSISVTLGFAVSMFFLFIALMYSRD